MIPSRTILWKSEPDAHDYPAASLYLQLCMRPNVSDGVVEVLRKVGMSAFKAKDIFRAAGLPELNGTNVHVARNLNAIDRGMSLSPILLVVEHSRLIIADGYHRLCAVHQYDEDATIPCKIAYVAARR